MRIGREVIDSPLARRDPSVKLLLLTAVSLAISFVFDPATALVTWLASVVAVRVGARMPLPALIRGQWPFALFGLGIFVVNALSRPGVVVWQAGWLRVTEEGLAVGTALALRALTIGVLALGFLVSTAPVPLLTSMRDVLRLPPTIAYAVLAGYRLLQDLPREWDLLRAAHAVREPGEGPVRLRARAVPAVVFGLLVVSIRRAERIAQSLETRGLGLRPRTTWRPTAVTALDGALVAGTLAVLGGVVALSVALGWWTGPGALAT